MVRHRGDALVIENTIYKYIYILAILAGAVLRVQAQGDTTVMLGTYYADKFVGRKTASGDIFRQNQYTAAHKSIPLGTFLRVLNPYTGLEIVVRVNDRCPIKGVLDMTKIAVLKLGIRGSRKVKVVTMDPEEGFALWAQQDTLDMSHEEYMTFKDKSPVRRMTPYPVSTPTSRSSIPPPDIMHETATETPTTEAPPSETPDTFPTASPAAETESPSLLAELPAPKQEKLYNLAICISSSKASAQRAILRLPKELQGRAIIEKIPNTRQVRVVLTLATPRSHAIRVQAMLIEDFPESFLVPHSEREKDVSE